MQYTTVLLLALGLVGAGAVKWGLKDTDGKYCAIFSAETITAKLNIINAENVTETINFNINATAKPTTGNCHYDYNGHPANKIEAFFYPNGEQPKSATDAQPWQLTLIFTTDNQDAAFKLVDYNLEISPSPLFNTTTQVFSKSSSAVDDVHASGTNGFKCSKSGLALSDDSSIDLKDARVIANAKLDTDTFDGQVFEQCPLDARTSDIVPIVVGACLAGLVAVVLIAYLVGRARAKRQGYASV